MALSERLFDRDWCFAIWKRDWILRRLPPLKDDHPPETRESDGGHEGNESVEARGDEGHESGGGHEGNGGEAFSGGHVVPGEGQQRALAYCGGGRHVLLRCDDDDDDDDDWIFEAVAAMKAGPK